LDEARPASAQTTLARVMAQGSCLVARKTRPSAKTAEAMIELRERAPGRHNQEAAEGGMKI
jgi:hypothetical protein